MVVQLGPVPATNEQSAVKQNLALQTLFSGTNQNTSNIATNTTNIATNTANIATNTTDIATNRANIVTNTANIATNTANIATNTASIAAIVASAILTNVRVAVTGSVSASNANKGKTYALANSSSGAILTFTLTAASGYDPDYQIMVVNEGTRGWKIAASGITTFILWPGQSKIVFAQNNVWHFCPEFERYAPPSITVNVDPVSGDDSQDGLATGAGSFLTIQAAVDAVMMFVDSKFQPPVFQLANGTYLAGAAIHGPVTGGADQIIITGSASAIIQISSGICFDCRDYGTLTLIGTTLVATGANCTGLSASQFGTIDANGVTFGNFATGNHITVSSVGSFNFTGSYNITGGAATHINVSSTSQATVASGIGVTITGTPTFSFFFLAQGSSTITFNATIPYTGGISGQKYLVQSNSSMLLAGTTLPGGIAGVPAPGATVLNASPFGGQVFA